MINKSTNAPTMIPMIAPMGSSSSGSSISGVKVTVGVITDDVTDMVTVGLMNSLEGVTIGTTRFKKKLHHYIVMLSVCLCNCIKQNKHKQHKIATQLRS